MTVDTTGYPPALAEVLEDFGWVSDRHEQTEMLIQYADQFKKVPDTVASPPYEETHRVPACESEAYVWAEDQRDGTLQYYFAVDNPQGLSAMAMAAILDKTLSGQPPDAIAKVSPEIVFDIFGKEISMGKGQGLTSMVGMVQAMAKERIASK
jgi:cysteine desulfuration protein SufE